MQTTLRLYGMFRLPVRHRFANPARLASAAGWVVLIYVYKWLIGFVLRCLLRHTFPAQGEMALPPAADDGLRAWQALPVPLTLRRAGQQTLR